MSWSLETEEDIEKFAIWLIDQYTVGGITERDKATLPLTIDRYFEGDLDDE